MKIGFVSAILPELSLTEVVQFAKEEGFDSVEVMCWPPGVADRRYAGVTHIDITDLDQTKAEEIKRLLHASGIEISGLGYYANPLSPVKVEAITSQAHIRKLILAAELLDVSVVNTFVGKDWTKSLEENWPAFLNTWKPLVAFAASSDIRLGIENCPMFFTRDEWPGGKNLMTSPMIWQNAFESIPSDHFGLNFDPSHFIWQKMDYIKATLNFGHKFFHVHAKDATLDVQRLDKVGLLAYPSQYHTPKIPGMGDVNWKAFIQALGETQYNGHVSIEIEDRNFEGSIQSRKEALRLSLSHLRQFIPTDV